MFIVQDLDFNFGDILEIRAGQFALSGDSFSGEGLEIFIGSGPSKLENGDINPAAIGVLIRNASITFIKGTGAGSRLGDARRRHDRTAGPGRARDQRHRRVPGQRLRLADPQPRRASAWA